MPSLTRRRLLKILPATIAAWGLGRRTYASSVDPVLLSAEHASIEVHGRAANVLRLRAEGHERGLALDAGQRFFARLRNDLDEPTLIHWHGLTPPTEQDGVPLFSQAPLRPGGAYEYDFPLVRPGTNWMHSHVGLQEQRLLAAPLIVRDPAEAGLDEQEVVVMLHDFTFRDPDEILDELRGGAGGMAGMDHSMMDLNDIAFDAYLANDRTLDDPEIVRVDAGGRVRLRIINAAAATNFFIDLGALEGVLIAVDGMEVVPLSGSRFELAVAQRLDLRLSLPRQSGVYPVLAQREGDAARTGILLATKDAALRKVAGQAETPVGAVGLDLERRLLAAIPLARRPAGRVHMLDLTGSMMGYAWGFNGGALDHQRRLPVRDGERIHLVLRNRTDMSHPIHLHGHHFQVVAIDDEPIAGAMRDTVLVPIAGSVTIAFDADNPGLWALHCHNIYHMVAGMMTGIDYTS
jgi:FtsP/CotA-like multicopper oxidase with cupredoxin domain